MIDPEPYAPYSGWDFVWQPIMGSIIIFAIIQPTTLSLTIQWAVAYTVLGFIFTLLYRKFTK